MRTSLAVALLSLALYLLLAASADLTTSSSTSSSSSAMASSAGWMWERLRGLWIPTSPQLLEQAEKKILAPIKAPFRQSQVAIAGQQTINTLHFAGPAQPIKQNTPLVLLHGFGAGVGFWLLNLDALAARQEVYAIDLLGSGRSSRPRFTARTVEEAEGFFVKSLEEWRKSLGIERMILAGHSFGSICAAAYTEQHPDNVQHLILLSPVGVPERPEHVEVRTPPNLPLPYRIARQGIRTLWDYGLSVQTIVRALGPWGKNPVNNYVTRRFTLGPAADDFMPRTDSPNAKDRQTSDSAEMLQDDASGEAASSLAKQIDAGALKLPKADLADYLYHLCAAPGSAEYALNVVLSTDVYAKKPLANRLPEVGKRRPVLPITWLYGATDWMPVDAGRATAQKIRENGGESSVHTIPDSGHQLNIDNPSGFHSALLSAIERHSNR